MMVGAILTQNTAWTNVEKAIAALKRTDALSVHAIAHMPCKHLEKLIRSSGYFRQKARRLQEFARAILNDHALRRNLMPSSRRKPGSRGIFGLGPGFHRGDVKTMRDRLLSFNGVGPETADSILLYAGGYPTFVVDAYTRRIGQRLGLFKTNDYDEIQEYFHQRCRGGRLAARACQYNEFHALLVRLAKEICTKRHPRCAVCPVRDICKFGMKPSPALRAPSPASPRERAGPCLLPALAGRRWPKAG